MEKVYKKPSIAGMFYPEDKEKLQNQIDGFKMNCKHLYPITTRAVIVPHAGLIFSGELAYRGLSHLDKSLKNLFIIAPSHHELFKGIALTSYDGWETPLGRIDVNTDIVWKLKERYGGFYFDQAYRYEHSVEIEVPLIQNLFNEDVKIIPILTQDTDVNLISKLLADYYPDEQNGFIITSDLSHFLTDEQANKLDTYSAKLIEQGNVPALRPENACGYKGISGLSVYSFAKHYSLLRVGLTNSSSTYNDKMRVVGYGAWILYEDDKNEFIKEYYSDFLLKLCHDIIEAPFTKKEIKINLDEVFYQRGACFITIEKFGQLRGCIGSTIAHRSLIEDLIEHTKNSAFKDPRFNPIQYNELKDLKISISLLSIPREIRFENEEDLLNQIEEKTDGIIIKDGDHQAVYLPSVWEQLPDKKEFLNNLKVKAGLSADYFSESIEAFKFQTVYIQEK